MRCGLGFGRKCAAGLICQEISRAVAVCIKAVFPEASDNVGLWGRSGTKTTPEAIRIATTSEDWGEPDRSGTKTTPAAVPASTTSEDWGEPERSGTKTTPGAVPATTDEYY